MGDGGVNYLGAMLSELSTNERGTQTPQQKDAMLADVLQRLERAHAAGVVSEAELCRVSGLLGKDIKLLVQYRFLVGSAAARLSALTEQWCGGKGVRDGEL